jgi:hypothetical protein
LLSTCNTHKRLSLLVSLISGYKYTLYTEDTMLLYISEN